MSIGGERAAEGSSSPACRWGRRSGKFEPRSGGSAGCCNARGPSLSPDCSRQQIAEPREETRGRDDIARLTTVHDDVSRKVRQQYEENPYPRWVDAGRIVRPTTLQAWLRALSPDAGLREGSGGDILIAGCGTGQQAIEAAQNHPDARVLAVDLSLSSLAYARRKTRALGLANIEYGQADILRLDAIARTFDLIGPSECCITSPIRSRAGACS